jgi:hypothetical protein
MSRTINIHITNYTGLTLGFGNAQSGEGPAATANMTSVASGGTMIVSAYNNSTFNGGNKGTFTLTSGSVQFLIFYTHPQTTGSSYVQVQQQTTGYISGVSAQTYSGDPIDAYVNLYRGVGVAAPNAAMGYAVPLASNPYDQSNNVQDFVNSMFGPNMRAPSLVSASYNQSADVFTPADFTGGQMASPLVQTLTSLWMGTASASNTDSDIIAFLKGFVGGNNNQTPLNMVVPSIIYQPNTDPSAPSSYVLDGYTTYEMMGSSGGSYFWNQEAVTNFLTLLVGGAHFVSISADQDYQNAGQSNPGRDLYAAFRSSGLTQRGDLGNSHYCGVAPVNTTGEYYLDIGSDFAPAGCAFILSLLFGRTVNSVSSTPGTYNTFMQLEGWPANGLTGGSRHGADYNAYKQSLWNISTYGAAPYSEKRATTVFLTTPGFPIQAYQTTCMMPYVGAYATGTYPNGKPQSWLNTSVVSVGSGQPQLPSKYYTS